MQVQSRLAEVTLVDRFLQEQKTLSGAQPEFGSKREGKRDFWEAVWPVANSIGTVNTGEIRVTNSPASDKPFSIILIYRSQCIYRYDFVSADICHYNPPWARVLGVSQEVCGPHRHPWSMNRQHILDQDRWELPCRVALPARIHRFDQAFAAFAKEINLTLTASDRTFDLPKELF